MRPSSISTTRRVEVAAKAEAAAEAATPPVEAEVEVPPIRILILWLVVAEGVVTEKTVPPEVQLVPGAEVEAKVPAVMPEPAVVMVPPPELSTRVAALTLLILTAVVAGVAGTAEVVALMTKVTEWAVVEVVPDISAVPEFHRHKP